MAESIESKKKRAQKIILALSKIYTSQESFLKHNSPLQLLVAVILSAQCTDARVNLVTPALFKRFKRAKDYAECDLTELENYIRSTGFYKNKAQNIKKMALLLEEKFEGQVPSKLEELVSLPGVGRKTANVILSQVWDVPSMVVDTHVTRLGNRLDLARGKDAVKLEFLLREIIQKKYWSQTSRLFISHGRAICLARTPLCSECMIRELCPQRGVTKSR